MVKNSRIVKWLPVVLIVAVILFYFAIMAMFQGPIVREVTSNIIFSTNDKEIELPWYLNHWIEEEMRFEGLDEDGNQYTWFSYSMPDIFEEAEAVIIVSWADCRATLFIGESRAMDIIETKYPMIEYSAPDSASIPARLSKASPVPLGAMLWDNIPLLFS